MSDCPLSEEQTLDLIEAVLKRLDPLLGPDLSVSTTRQDDGLRVEITAVVTRALLAKQQPPIHLAYDTSRQRSRCGAFWPRWPHDEERLTEDVSAVTCLGCIKYGPVRPSEPSS